MTNQEAVARIKDHKAIHKMNEPRAIYISQALDKAIEALENQKSIIDELENIKTEIQGLIDFEESCCGNTTLGYQCLGVVEDKISELKGE